MSFSNACRSGTLTKNITQWLACKSINGSIPDLVMLVRPMRLQFNRFPLKFSKLLEFIVKAVPNQLAMYTHLPSLF